MPLARLTLLVPELLWPEPEDREVLDRLACPVLAALFARGRFLRAARQSAEAALMALFGHAAGAACGAFRLCGESGFPADAATARWLAADPVHLHLEHERLILADSRVLAIAEDEAAALVGELNRYFADLGVFHAACAGRWYLRLAEGDGREGHGALARLDAPPPSAVAGRGVERWLLEIMEARQIRQLLNEAQSVLHTHPVNQRREENGQMSINSLWLWGGGNPPQAPATVDFDSVWSDDPLARGLAHTAGVTAHPLPDDANALFGAMSGTRLLAVFGDLCAAVHYANDADYRQALAALETRWFAPAWRALARGAIGSLRLVAPTAYGTLTWDIGLAAKWCFWRRPRTLADTVRALAASAGKVEETA